VWWPVVEAEGAKPLTGADSCPQGTTVLLQTLSRLDGLAGRRPCWTGLTV